VSSCRSLFSSSSSSSSSTFSGMRPALHPAVAQYYLPGNVFTGTVLVNPCHPWCATCFGFESSQCFNCNSGYFLFESVNCVEFSGCGRGQVRGSAYPTFLFYIEALPVANEGRCVSPPCTGMGFWSTWLANTATCCLLLLTLCSFHSTAPCS
jgi:hypothetical protein